MLTNIYADDLSGMLPWTTRDFNVNAKQSRRTAAVVNDTDIMRSYLKTADSMAHQYMNVCAFEKH